MIRARLLAEHQATLTSLKIWLVFRLSLRHGPPFPLQCSDVSFARQTKWRGSRGVTTFFGQGINVIAWHKLLIRLLCGLQWVCFPMDGRQTQTPFTNWKLVAFIETKLLVLQNSLENVSALTLILTIIAHGFKIIATFHTWFDESNVFSVVDMWWRASA